MQDNLLQHRDPCITRRGDISRFRKSTRADFSPGENLDDDVISRDSPPLVAR